MFQGSENYNDEFFKPMEEVGATSHQRHDQLRSHQLFPERADHRARARAVDGIGSHGASARCDRPGTARRAARRGEEREAPGREPAVRTCLRLGGERQLSGGSPLSLAADRLDGGPRRREPRRRQGVVPHLLRRGQRGAGARRRHRCRHCARRRRRSTSATYRRALRSRDRRPGSRRARKPRARRCTTRWRRRACTGSGTPRRTARRKPICWSWRARSWAAARHRGSTSVSCTATRSRTAPLPARTRSRSRGCSVSRPT